MMHSGRWLSVLGLVCVMGVSLPARAAPDRTLSYDVYAGGIHALAATLSIDETSGRYDLRLDTATTGFLKKVAPWSGVFRTLGWTSAAGVRQPERHSSAATWKGETETKTYTYTKDGKFGAYKVVEAGKDKTPTEIDPKLTPAGTIDVLSATLRVMDQLSAGSKCIGSSLVFDGDRNFKMIFAEKARDTLGKSDYNIYQGPAVACTIEVKPEAGKWRKKPRGWLSIQEQGRKAGTMPTIWFAILPDDSSGRYVPVRIQVKTDYGTLMMHLTGAKGAGFDKPSSPVKKAN